MLELDHVAMTVFNLTESIEFYKQLGYQVENQFEEEDYRWASLKLGSTSLELFEPVKKGLPKIEHLAYRFTEEKEAIKIARRIQGTEEPIDFFYGDLNRKSFFLDDNNGRSIQFIKKKEN